MEQVPREMFVPLESRHMSYLDLPLAIGEGQTISQPYIVALMSELLKLTPESKVLEVGTGSGYQAAVLSHLTSRVYTIEIVKPFTRVKSFDDDASPDGIELLLQAVNPLGNVGLMIVGVIRVELYEHVKASGIPTGKRLDSWTIDLASEESQRRYWNHVTQMYQLRLTSNHAVVSVARRYVLVVTYTSPLGEHLTDDCVIERRAISGPLGGARARGG